MEKCDQLQLLAINTIDIIKRLSTEKNLNEKSTIIFDIDNTLIDKYGKGMMPIITIYHYAKLFNIRIIIITSRSAKAENIERTQDQLHGYGICDYENIYFMKEQSDVALFKYNARQKIREKGYDTILTLGDLDLDGLNCQYAGIFIKIPKN